MENQPLLPSKVELPVLTSIVPLKEEKQTQSVSLIPLVFLTYFLVSGGPYGVEGLISAAYPFWCLILISVLPWFWCLPTALMTAELSTTLPSNSGYILWIQEAFGDSAALQVGLWRWVCNVTDGAAYPIMFHDYLARFMLRYAHVNIYPTAIRIVVTFVACLFLGILNFLGLELLGTASMIFALFVSFPFLLLIGGGIPKVDIHDWSAQKPGGFEDVNWTIFLSIFLWSLSGWDSIGNIVENIKNPKRNFPLGMILTVTLATLTTLLPIAICVSLDKDWSKWDEGDFPYIGKELGGILGEIVQMSLILTACFSALGQGNVALYANAESFAALGEKELLNIPFFTWLSKRETPWMSILINSVVVFVLTTFSFNTIIGIDMTVYCFALIVEFFAFLWLKFKRTDLIRPYVFPFGKIGALLCCLPNIGLCVFLIVTSEPVILYATVGVIAISFIIAVIKYGKDSISSKSHRAVPVTLVN